MKLPRFHRILLPVVLVLYVPLVQAGDDSREGGGSAAPGTAAGEAHAWLMKMNEAPRQHDFEGTFVYHHGDQIEAMRIAHKAEQGMVRERLVSLNGAAREIVRNEREVLCYLPDQNSVVVEHRKSDARGFPTILPERLPELDEHYVIQLGKSERVAGRVARQITIRPRDGYRYGYQLWADHDTGLLLRADLLDRQGRPLEQFMFTQLRIGPVPASALQPETPGKGMVWYRERGEPPATAATQQWNVTQLPGGFRLSHRVMRNVPMRNKTVEHLVYSDGLATVSLFVEPLDKSAKSAMQGPSHMGAVHAYGARVNGHQVTVVGEVPAETVAQIARSVAPAR